MLSDAWARWFSLLQAGALQPTTPAILPQTGALFMGSGVPSGGSDGDFFFRTDTPGTTNQRLYTKVSGSWVGIL